MDYTSFVVMTAELWKGQDASIELSLTWASAEATWALELSV